MNPVNPMNPVGSQYFLIPLFLCLTRENCQTKLPFRLLQLAKQVLFVSVYFSQINRSFKESQQKILDEYRNSLITLVNSYDCFSLETSLLKDHRMGKYVRGLNRLIDIEHLIFCLCLIFNEYYEFQVLLFLNGMNIRIPWYYFILLIALSSFSVYFTTSKLHL